MFSSITNELLMSLTVKALYTKDLDPEIRDFILFVAYTNGLLNEHGEKTDSYLALMTDDLEKLVRKLTGKQKQASGLCICGCGRNPRGRSRYARAACRKKVSRYGKVTGLENAQKIGNVTI